MAKKQTDLKFYFPPTGEKSNTKLHSKGQNKIYLKI